MNYLRKSLAALAVSTSLIGGVAIAQTEQPAAPQQAANQAQQQGQMTADSIMNQPVYSSTGTEAGRITGVAVNQSGEHFVVVTLNDNYGNREAAVPASNIGQQDGRLVFMQLTDAQLKELPAYQAGQNDMQAADANTPLMLGSGQANDAGANIMVQQQAPTIRIEPTTPQVTVQQPTPEVSVSQPQPEILVRQPPPTITVDMPQPEIIVRMPEPNVSVSMAQPQVQVQVPKPQVQVVQPEQPQVQVAPTNQANVAVQPPEGQAQVNIQRTQPKVRVERTGEPRVIFNQAQGEPQIRFERMGEADVGKANQQAAAPANTQSNTDANNTAQTAASEPSTGTLDPATQEGVSNSDVVTDTANTTASTTATDADQQAVGTAPAGRLLPIQASDLRGRDVYNRAGNELGEVSDVLIDSNNKAHLVVEYGGFLGIGERRVVLPIDHFAVQGNDRLIIPGMTEDELRNLQAWDRNMQGYRSAENDFKAEFNPLQ
jgi:sporulation protein YlmC with PRC-barrel domain